MKIEEIKAHSNSLILKISVIAGWQIPESKEYITILEDQFRKKIMESYRDMNPDEIEYAIRTYGTQIPDWGKSMNLSLIDEAIRSYLALRREISYYEERASKPERQIAPAPADWSAEWEQIKKGVKDGATVIIPTAVYDWLDREGMIDLTNDQKKDLMKQAAGKILAEIKDDVYKNGSSLEKRNRIAMLESGEYNNQLQAMIKRKAKTLAVIQLANQ